MSDREDEELRRRFGELRARDARKAPPFETLARAGKPKRTRSPWAVVAAVTPLAAAAAVLVLWCSTQKMSANAPSAAAPPPPPIAAGESAASTPAAVAVADGKSVTPPAHDPAPLDFLLDLPGSSALAAASDLEPTRQGWSR